MSRRVSRLVHQRRRLCTCRATASRALAILVLYCGLSLLAGCGGGGNTVNPTQNGTGRARFAIAWPVSHTATTARSVLLEIRSGVTVIASRTIDQPASGTSATALFDQLPVEPLAYTASAFSQPDGKGVLLGTVTKRIEIRANQQRNIDLTVRLQGDTILVDGIEMCIPLTTTIGINDSVQLAASAVDTANELVFAMITWSSNTPAIATVDNHGKVTGKSLGSCTIVATEPRSGKQASMLINVAHNAPQVTIFPSNPQLTVGHQTTLRAGVRNSAGEEITAEIAWTSANPGIASVNAQGMVTGITPGQTTVTATARILGAGASVTVNVTEPAHANGGRIVFYSDRTGNPEIYLMNADGTGVRQLTDHPGADTDPIFSPDGSRIAFVSDRAGGQSIMLMGGNGDSVEFIVNDGARNIDPSFTHDGTELVYASDATGNFEIYRMNVATGAKTRLTQNAADNRHPSVSPDGRLIVFTSKRSGNADIFLMKADGSDGRRLTTDPHDDGYPVFNPSGTQIAFVSNREGEHVAVKTHTMNLDGSNQRRVVNANHCTRMPAYNPGGQQFVFAANPEQNFDIYIANRDGSGFTPLLTGPGKEMHPSWGP